MFLRPLILIGLCFLVGASPYLLNYHPSCQNWEEAVTQGSSDVPDVRGYLDGIYSVTKDIASIAIHRINHVYYNDPALTWVERDRILGLMATFMVPPPWPGQDATAWQGVVSGLTTIYGNLYKRNLPNMIVCGTEASDTAFMKVWTDSNGSPFINPVTKKPDYAYQVNLFNSPFYTEVGFKLCQEDTQTDGISFLSIQPKFLVLCAASLGRGPKLGEWPTTIAARGQGLPAWTLSQWGRGILATLMHEEHHILGGGNGTSEDIVLKPPIVNPTTGQVQESRGYGYLGTTTLVNQVLARTIAGETMAWQDVIANPDSSVYLALAIYLIAFTWVRNSPDPLPFVDLNPAFDNEYP